MMGLVYNVMYSTSKVLSITTGHLAMVGAVGGAWFMESLGWPLWWALPGSIAIGIAFGLLTDLIGIRRVLNRSDEHLWLLSTLAIATMVQQAVGLWWGTEPRPFPRIIPQTFAGAWDQKYWLPIAAVLLMMLGLELFYRRTIYGKVFIAMSEDAFAARARGIPTDRVRALSFALAGALGTFAGFAAGQLTFAFFAIGNQLTLNGFIGLAVGGLGSNSGALAGGLILGVVSVLATHFFGGEYQQTIAIGLLIVVLIIRPAGIFGVVKVRAV
jgi:branched-chain amino acid transport system permease protein